MIDHMNSEASRYQSARNVTLLGAVVNTLLGIIKVVFGILGHSQALFADGIHSFSDLITDAMVIFASRYGSRAADPEHPYGHGRIETAVTVALSQLLIIVGLGIMLDAGFRLWQNNGFERPSQYVIWVALISILANEGLFHITRRVAKKIHSQLFASQCLASSQRCVFILSGIDWCDRNIFWFSLFGCRCRIHRRYFDCQNGRPNGLDQYS